MSSTRYSVYALARTALTGHRHWPPACCASRSTAFPPGECRSTLLARVGVLIAREETGFLLFAPRSYAHSLRGWLALDKG